MYGSAPTTAVDPVFNAEPDGSTESDMYIGGILGTILIIALVVFFLRRV
jgi:nitrate reductase gamma subunit